MSVNVISPRQLIDLCTSGNTIDVIDVRTPAEFQEVHLQPTLADAVHQFEVDERPQERGREFRRYHPADQVDERNPPADLVGENGLAEQRAFQFGYLFHSFSPISFPI